MPQQNRDAAGILSKPIRDLYQAIKALQSGIIAGPVTVSGAVTVTSGSITIQEPLSVDDNGASLTVDATLIEDTTNTQVKAGDAANKAVRVNIVAGGGSGGTSAVDDAAFTAAAGSGTPMMGFVTADSVDSGDVGVIGMLANRQVKVTLYDSAGVELAVGGGTQYTEDAVATANPIGNATILIADDTPALEVADGDNVAQRGTRYGAAYTQIVSSAGAFIDSFGGGTQYTEGDTDATITGTAAMWEDGSDTLRAISMAKPLPVQPGTAITFPISAASLPLPAGAATSALQTQPGVDIGDVTVNNAAGASAVNIQDGGNTITVDGTVAVTNGGTFVVQENGTQVQVDDAAFTPAVSKVVMVGATFDDVAPDSVNEGDGGALRMSANRNAYVTLRDAAGNERGLNIDANNAAAVTNTTLSVVNNGAAATALRVTLANDSTGIVRASNKSATSTLTSVGASVTSVTVLASNASRNYAIIHNDSATATLKIKYGATASSTSFTGPPIRPGATAVIEDGYTGIIDGIWDIASGNARITELTA